MTQRDAIWLVAGLILGWFGLIVIKYQVIGLPAWDAELHPERLPCDVPNKTLDGSGAVWDYQSPIGDGSIG